MVDFSRRSFVSAAVAAGFYGGSAMAQNDPPIVGNRVALKGYDPVSYVAEGKPEKGSSEFTFAFDDTTYWFKSAEQQDKFAADPKRYAPQFDGYCATQLSRGRKIEPIRRPGRSKTASSTCSRPSAGCRSSSSDEAA